ncbi:MAG: antibiotic biosynthesis monooxygenase [Deltaproteobacteria bacterium]|nr:antibiotic biosynthesis monooxygenase [Deltaproteobacteria bacterium]
MYIAMNRFTVAEGREEDFERVWRERDSHLAGVPGFEAFNLLRGATAEGKTLFASHSVWTSHEAFVAWTESEAFRKAHSGARTPEGILLGPPRFEGFEQVL